MAMSVGPMEAPWGATFRPVGAMLTPWGAMLIPCTCTQLHHWWTYHTLEPSMLLRCVHCAACAALRQYGFDLTFSF